MNNNLTSRDVPKILIVLGLLLALGCVGVLRIQGAAAQQEEKRANLQMKRESGQIITAADEDLSPAEADEEKNRRDDADPNFHS